MKWTIQCSPAVVMLLMLAEHLPAQTQVSQFLPEVDTYVGFNMFFRSHS